MAESKQWSLKPSNSKSRLLLMKNLVKL